jgi:hypothetical protein
MSEPEDGSPGAAAGAEQLAAAVTASVAPFSCMYGCAVGLVWLLGGAIVGLLLALASRGIHLQ